jgi:hypothetical protein
MRRTLKLLLLLGIGLALAKNKNGDGITPGDGDNTVDPTTGKPKSDEQRKKDTDYNGTSAQDDFDGVMKQGDQESQDGRKDGAGGESTNNEPGTDNPNLEPSYPDQWASDGNLRSHWEDHRRDDNADWESEAEYREAAIDLMSTDGGRRPGVKIKTDGDTSYFFDPATGEFGRSGPRGIITYYIPSPDPQAHFDRQPGTEV